MDVDMDQVVPLAPHVPAIPPPGISEETAPDVEMNGVLFVVLVSYTS